MSVTPQFIGQRYKDTNNGNIWKANSLTAGDWTLELQNMQMGWTPSSAKLGQIVAFYSQYGELDAGLITDLTLYEAQMLGGITIIGSTGLLTLSCPNLTQIDPTNTYEAAFFISGCTGLTSVSCPLLTAVGNGFILRSCTSLSSLSAPLLQSGGSGIAVDVRGSSLAALSLPSLGNISGDLVATGSTSLTSVSFPSFTPTNGKQILFSDCALTAASVNHILARCVANAGYVTGLVDLSLGTSSAPTGQGVTDKNTLNARHLGLAVTN